MGNFHIVQFFIFFFAVSREPRKLESAKYFPSLTICRVENTKNFNSSYITICIGTFNNLHWKQSKFLLFLQHKALTMASGRVDFSSPDLI